MPATRDTLLHTPNAVARTLVVYLQLGEELTLYTAKFESAGCGLGIAFETYSSGVAT